MNTAARGPAVFAQWPAVWLGTALLMCAGAYWPGLAGGFLFDDYPNLVDNTALHIEGSGWRDWRRAALASPSTELRRPLSMLSFAVNYRFTGLAPRPMKLTNLGIHLLNGVLVYLVLAQLFRLRPVDRGGVADEPQAAALGIAGLWLLCPINSSAVLYIVQRMESLAQVFVLGGLYLYLRGRRAMLASGQGAAIAATGLLLGTALGALCKESAALLPVYALAVELTVLHFGAARVQARRALWAIYAVMLFIPAALGLAWVGTHALSPGAYAGRPFTLGQRLWTECRVLVRYADWTLLPRPDELGFYHDDIPLSKGWLSPPTTAMSAALLAGALAGAFALRRRAPLFAIGVLWFFAAHLLTATVIPLELAFEHRNYFASLGLLIAACGLLQLLPPPWRILQAALPLTAAALFGFVLSLRAHEWSNPIAFAYSAAAEHPASPRASYELGRTLAVASAYRQDSALIEPAMRAFQHAAALPGAGAAPYAAMIIVASHMHRRVDPHWWVELAQRLRDSVPSADDIGALQSLSDCQRSSGCPPQTAELLTAFLAALDHGAPGSLLLGEYGAFAANSLGDYTVAANAFEEAARQSPQNADYRIELARVFYLKGDLARAQEVVAGLDAAVLDEGQAAAVQQLHHSLSATARAGAEDPKAAIAGSPATPGASRP